MKNPLKNTEPIKKKNIQTFKTVFYKRLLTRWKDVYLFKHYDKIGMGKWNLTYISARHDRKGKKFIVESGGGISEQRMVNQIKSYLNKKLNKQGYF